MTLATFEDDPTQGVNRLMTTREAIDELHLERELRRLPHEVHHAVYRWVLNKTLRFVDGHLIDTYLTLTDTQRALAAAHSTYQAFAERTLARWTASLALGLEENVERELRKRPHMRQHLARSHNSYVSTARHLLGIVVLVNAERERDPEKPRPPGWPFFSDCFTVGEGREGDGISHDLDSVSGPENVGRPGNDDGTPGGE